MHGLQHARLPCPSISPGVCSSLCPLCRWCHLTISSSVILLSCCPQSLPASEFFPVSCLFTSGGQSIGVLASTSVLPMNIQGWFPLGSTGLIFLQFKGLLRVFSNIKFKSIYSLALSILYGPTLTSIPHYWKNHSFNCMDLCWQSTVCFLIHCRDLSYLPLHLLCFCLKNKDLDFLNLTVALWLNRSDFKCTYKFGFITV